jgi:hypothetical protein
MKFKDVHTGDLIHVAINLKQKIGAHNFYGDIKQFRKQLPPMFFTGRKLNLKGTWVVTCRAYK